MKHIMVRTEPEGVTVGSLREWLSKFNGDLKVRMMGRDYIRTMLLEQPEDDNSTVRAMIVLGCSVVRRSSHEIVKDLIAQQADIQIGMSGDRDLVAVPRRLLEELDR